MTVNSVHIPRVIEPRMHCTLRTSHFLSSSWTLVASRYALCLILLVMTFALLGRGKKSTRSTTPSSWMYRVCRMHDDGRYCCFVVQFKLLGGAMPKYPPLSLSKRRQKTEGESKSGLGNSFPSASGCHCLLLKAADLLTST